MPRIGSDQLTPNTTFSDLYRTMGPDGGRDDKHIRFTDAKGVYTSRTLSLSRLKDLFGGNQLRQRASKQEAGAARIRASVDRELGPNAGAKIFAGLDAKHGLSLDRGVTRFEMGLIAREVTAERQRAADRQGSGSGGVEQPGPGPSLDSPLSEEGSSTGAGEAHIAELELHVMNAPAKVRVGAPEAEADHIADAGLSSSEAQVEAPSGPLGADVRAEVRGGAPEGEADRAADAAPSSSHSPTEMAVMLDPGQGASGVAESGGGVADEMEPGPAPSDERPAPIGGADVRPATSAPVRLDHRGNDIAATQRESSWAVGTLSALGGPQVKLVMSHFNALANLIDVKAYEAPENKRIKDFLVRTNMPNLKAQNVSLAAYMRGQLPRPDGTYERGRGPINNADNGSRDFQGKAAIEFTLRSDDLFKIAIDRAESVISVLDPDIRKQGRDATPEFMDRGRIVYESDDLKSRNELRKSYKDANAGIVASENLRASTSNFFSKDRMHAKGVIARQQVPNGTAERFRDAGAPFIAGASGGISAIAQTLEYAGRRGKISSEEVKQREQLLGVHMATLVAGGHHSVSECLIAAKAYGYFADVPHPLTDYAGAMAGLQTRLAEVGLSAGGKSLTA